MRGAPLVIIVIGLGLVAGCKKDSSSSSTGATGAPASTAESDALWAMAPEGTSVGVVASPRAIAMGEHAWLDVRALLATAPELAPINAMLGNELQQALGKADATLADVGLTPTKGGAYFISPGGGGIAIIPVGDRDKFIAATHGTKGADSDKIGEATCKTVSGVYVCARTPDMFAKIGKGSLKKGLDPVGTRGDIEIVTSLPLPGGQGMIAGVLQLGRGTVVARAAITGVPETITSRLGGTQIKARGDLDKTAGFGIVSLAPLLAGAPPLPLVAGVTLADLSKTISGPVTVHIPPGAPELDVRIPLNDPKPAATLIEHCTEIPPLAQAGATFSDGACHLNVPSVGYQLDFWVEGQEIRIGKKGPATGGTAVPMTAIGAEMAKQESAFAFWGRGTLFGQSIMNFPKLPAMPAELLMAIRALGMLSELGGTLHVDKDKLTVTWVVRTAWSNPDDVIAKLVAITPEMFLDGKATVAAKAIADGAPTSPFAADFKAGTGGLMAPMAVIGMASAIAIPAFMDYMKKGKKSEAQIMLNRIGKSAKIYYTENAAFPIADAPLTPPASCCSTQGKCPPAGAGWLNEAWTKLDFQIDEPTLFQYRYHSDGKTLDAEAIGDLDCDGVEVTYKLHVGADQGNPTATLTEPPPNSD